MKEAVTMSAKNLDRFHILKKIEAKELTQVEGSLLLKLGERQVRRLLVRLKEEGPKGIVSKLAGRSGNRAKSCEFKRKVMVLLREKYEGFGPTLASEKLLAIEGLKVSNETVRKWMMESQMWTTRKRRKNLHPSRNRRSCFGELIQADGSPYHWFGENEPSANLTVLIDDATSRITGLYFSETETLGSYFKALEQHLTRYGRPRALYTDHFSVFRSSKETGKTQMQIALNELEIESIVANSPQAKGRVERVNRTLQDRLTKELCLRGIKTIEEANDYLEEYVEEHNRKFSKEPMSVFNAHRPLEGYDLERILCRKEVRSLDCCGIFQFNKIHYQVQGKWDYSSLNKEKVEIRVKKEGEMRVFLKEKEVEVMRLDEIVGGPIELNRKELMYWNPRGYKVKATHPWKIGLQRETIKNRMTMV